MRSDGGTEAAKDVVFGLEQPFENIKKLERQVRLCVWMMKKQKVKLFSCLVGESGRELLDTLMGNTAKNAWKMHAGSLMSSLMSSGTNEIV